VLPGDVALGCTYLRDSVRFIEDTATTQGVAVDKAAYERAMEGQRDKARAKSGFKGGSEPTWYVEDRAEINALNDAFRGYDTTRMVGVPIAILSTNSLR
jgi:alanyl-tRNA synthetase